MQHQIPGYFEKDVIDLQGIFKRQPATGNSSLKNDLRGRPVTRETNQSQPVTYAKKYETETKRRYEKLEKQ